jgi:signal transduction histidine kinase
MAGIIETLVDSQHQLLRDVSHELRTPLTRLNLAVNNARHAPILQR